MTDHDAENPAARALRNDILVGNLREPAAAPGCRLENNDVEAHYGSREWGTIAIQNDTDWYEQCTELQDAMHTVQSEFSRAKNKRVLLGPVHLVTVGVGLIAAAFLLGFGIQERKEEKRSEFEGVAKDLVMNVEQAWNEYIFAGSFISHSCQRTASMTARQDLRDVYQSLQRDGLNFTQIFCLFNVSHAERPFVEADSHAAWDAYQSQFALSSDSSYYAGFRGVSRDAFVTRAEAAFYFVTHLIEPVETSLHLLDIDLYEPNNFLASSLLEVLEHRVPVVSKVFEDDSETNPFPPHSVVLFHPGLSGPDGPLGRIGAIVVNMNLFLDNLIFLVPELLDTTTVYLFDSTDEQEEATFLGAAVFAEKPCRDNPCDRSSRQVTRIAQPSSLSQIVQSGGSFVYREQVAIAKRRWTVVVLAEASEYQADISLIVLSAALIVTASVLVAAYLYSNKRRHSRVKMYRTESAAKTAQVRFETARRAAVAERELNDFIAHEVRNPLSAAISACSFVSSAVADREALVADDQARQTIREDVGIIEASLHFINDLLRNMLDMHRAASNEMKMELSYTEVQSDILDPVVAMLYCRDANFEVLVDCDPDLVIQTDKLRLKQVVLNLARNAAKFVDKGFIRLRAADVGGNVVLYVEDSGPGIPEGKKQKLFSKFQESLDSLQQGTGIGLAVCFKLVNLLGGYISLDESYNSGIPGCPGARFVVNLNTPPEAFQSLSFKNMAAVGGEAASETESMDSPPSELDDLAEQKGHVKPKHSSANPVPTDEEEEVKQIALPEQISVLFVDDDVLLRKLFMRSMKKFLPAWKVQEASSGEAALLKVKEEFFDLIFMDQYMASVGRQMLGTETVRALRSHGVESIICGLSANDMEVHFLNAGANAFMIKPFPCAEPKLRGEMHRVLQTSQNSTAAIENEEGNKKQSEEQCNNENVSNEAPP